MEIYVLNKVNMFFLIIAKESMIYYIIFIFLHIKLSMQILV